LAPAIRAIPGDAVAGKAPEVFLHAVLADIESATAMPAKGEILFAAMALPYFLAPLPIMLGS
jgi:hypothetical protein